MNTDFSQHIIIDNGAFSIKSGFNGENAPRSVVRSVIGKLKNENYNFLFDSDVTFIGDECFTNLSSLVLQSPFDDPVNTNLRHLEEIWNFVFYSELKVSPEAHNVFLVNSTFTNQKFREETAEIMFEKFNIFNLHMEPRGSLALWSTAKTSGLVVESDHLTTEIFPVIDKHLVLPGFRYTEVAGRSITKELENYITYQLPKNCWVGDKEDLARKIKEGFSEILEEEEIINRNDIDYTLPDGNVMKLGRERFDIPNSIFNSDGDKTPLHELIKESILACDIHIRKELVGNILIAGGNTMIKGYSETLKKKLEKIMGKNYEGLIKINCQKDRKYAVWTGASVICSISNFQSMWISKNEYEEIGPSVFHRHFIFK